MQPEPHFVIGEPTISPLHTEVAGNVVEVVNGSAMFSMPFPVEHLAIEESVIADDGTAWFILSAAETISTSADDANTYVIHFRLAHFDAAKSTVRAVELPPTHAATIPLAQVETDRRLTVRGGRATVMQGTQDGLELLSYQF